MRSLTDVNILASFGARDPSSRDHCEERTRFSCKAVRVNFLLQAFRPIARRAPAFSFNRSAPLFSVSVSRSKAILCLELDHQHSWMKPKTNLVVFLIGVLSDLFGLTQLGLQDRRFVLLHVWLGLEGLSDPTVRPFTHGLNHKCYHVVLHGIPFETLFWSLFNKV